MSNRAFASSYFWQCREDKRYTTRPRLEIYTEPFVADNADYQAASRLVDYINSKMKKPLNLSGEPYDVYNAEMSKIDVTATLIPYHTEGYMEPGKAMYQIRVNGKDNNVDRFERKMNLESGTVKRLSAIESHRPPVVSPTGGREVF